MANLGLASIIMNLSPPSHLSPRQRAIVIGNILGDGHVQLSPNGQKARLRFTHSASQAPYVNWEYRQLGSLCDGTQPPKQNTRERKNRTNSEYLAYTAYRPELKSYHTRFNRPTGQETPKVRKSIPEDLSSFLVDPISLMVWYLDDGTLRKDSGSCRLATQSFTAEEHTILQECLLNNFDVKARIEKWNDLYGLMIPTRGGHSKHFLSLFSHTVLEEIPSMSYKVRRETIV